MRGALWGIASVVQAFAFPRPRAVSEKKAARLPCSAGCPISTAQTARAPPSWLVISHGVATFEVPAHVIMYHHGFVISKLFAQHARARPKNI